MSEGLLLLIQRIAAARPLTIAQYMEMALQHPEYGYYRSHDPLGSAGDFITAPEISQVFGELIGLWCVDLWLKLGKPIPFALCELGPGRGTLMRDALRAAQVVPEFIRACRLFLLESNKDLRTAQAKCLASYRPLWLDSLSDLPSLPTLIISNEFFDALPIRQFVRQDGGWAERYVGVVDGVLRWVMGEVPPTLTTSFPCLRESDRLESNSKKDGYVFEISFAGQQTMQCLSRHILAHGGAVLAIDYGYAVPPGAPTFQAITKHRFSDPLQDPGNADLTTHVDFGALATVAQEHGCVAWPLLTQGNFLHRLGIDQRCAKLVDQATMMQRDAVISAHRRLTDSTEMGTLFKVLCIMPAASPVPAGWE